MESIQHWPWSRGGQSLPGTGQFSAEEGGCELLSATAHSLWSLTTWAGGGDLSRAPRASTMQHTVKVLRTLKWEPRGLEDKPHLLKRPAFATLKTGKELGH